jgi:hypothetical protein
MAQTKAVFELLRTCDNAKYFGILMPREVPMTITEHPYTSMIWYTPGTEEKETPHMRTLLPSFTPR